MSMLVLSLFFIGAALGMRFKVLILTPAIGLTIMAILARGMIHGDSASTVAITAFLAAGCLQIGYLGGAATRHTLTLRRAGRLTSLLSGSSSVAAPGHSTTGPAASTQYRG